MVDFFELIVVGWLSSAVWNVFVDEYAKTTVLSSFPKLYTHKKGVQIFCFCSSAIEEPMLVPQRTFVSSSENYIFCSSEKNILYSKNLFPLQRPFVQWTDSIMLKVLHETIDIK